MVGQLKIKEDIDLMIDRKTFPLFSIISGEEGMGKHTLCKYIADKLGMDLLLIGNKIDDIRKAKDIAEEYNHGFVFVLENSEDGSVAYKNSMLKLIEEPPLKSLILLLTANKQQLLPTIMSRGMLFELDPYTVEELNNFTQDELVLQLIQNPGIILKYKDVKFQELINYCNTVLTKMKGSTLGNCLKITSKLKVKSKKEITDGYDPLLFLLALRFVNKNNVQLTNNIDISLDVDNLISEFKNYLNMKSINSRYVMDEFIIKLYMILNRRA